MIPQPCEGWRLTSTKGGNRGDVTAGLCSGNGYGDLIICSAVKYVDQDGVLSGDLKYYCCAGEISSDSSLN